MLLAFNAINNLFGVGSSSMMSRALGRGDKKTARQSASFRLLVLTGLRGADLAVFPLLFRSGSSGAGRQRGKCGCHTGISVRTTCCGAVPAILNVVLAYMVRSEGASLHASIGTMSGCFLNILLDPVFILPWGFNMGAAGAGLATFLSNCVACCYFLVLMVVRRKSSCISLRPCKPDRQVVLGVCGVGIPAAIQNLLNVTGMTVLNNFTSVYGSNAVAAMGIAQKINQVPFYVALGLSQGLMPLVSYNYASGNYRRMKRCFFFAARLALSFLTVLSVLYLFNSDLLIALFMENPETVAYGSRFLHGMCLALPFLCMDFLAVGVFQACGMGAAGAAVRGAAQDRDGDPRAGNPEPDLASVRSGLCPDRGRGYPEHCGSAGAAEYFRTSGRPAGEKGGSLIHIIIRKKRQGRQKEGRGHGTGTAAAADGRYHRASDL